MQNKILVGVIESGIKEQIKQINKHLLTYPINFAQYFMITVHFSSDIFNVSLSSYACSNTYEVTYSRLIPLNHAQLIDVRTN